MSWIHLVHHDTERMHLINEPFKLAIAMGFANSAGKSFVTAACLAALGVVAVWNAPRDWLRLYPGAFLKGLLAVFGLCVLYCVQQALKRSATSIKFGTYCEQVSRAVLNHVVEQRQVHWRQV